LKDVWILSFVVGLYGLANGTLLNATPQLSLELQLGSRALGLIGAGLPIGYATSCLLFGRIFQRFSAKRVLMCGTFTALLSMLAMANATQAWMCVAAQFGYGLSSGAFWPFASSWMLDFQSETIPKTRVLRHYNVAWTSGTALGMYAGGLICKEGYIRPAIYAGASLMAATIVCALSARATCPHGQSISTKTVPQARRVALSVILAAVIANLIAIGTRTMFINNYAELNKALDFDADRLGLLAALCLMSQVVCFSTGRLYEKWLGMRRVYFLMAATLLGVNLAYAYGANVIILTAAVVLHGFVLAVSFQAGIIAAIGYFSSARIATTFHESVIGFGGIAPLLGGLLVEWLKPRMTNPLDALRAPFVCMCAIVIIGLVFQIILVSRRRESRVLMGSPENSEQAAIAPKAQAAA
jgi:MFS family permease